MADMEVVGAPPGLSGKFRLVIRLFRIRQWTKNLLLLAGVIFSHQILVLAQFKRALLAFVAFCLVSSALYLFNDIIDRESDRRHPRKRSRPIASGLVSIPAAGSASFLLSLAGLGLSWFLGRTFFAVAALYAGTTISYTLGLKHIAIIDVMAIAMGFVLRAVAGAVAVRVEISPWLLVCTMSLALFLALVKRRQETKTGTDTGSRRVLVSYSPVFLDQAVTIVTATTLMSYFLYTFSSKQSARLILTIPFVIYGVLRYLLLIDRRGVGEEPEEVLLSDRPFLINLLLWTIGSIAIMYMW